MFNITAALAAIIMMLAPSGNDFINPIDADVSLAKYENLINLSVSLDRSEYVRVKMSPVTYEELKQYALYECKNNRNPSVEVIDTLIEVEKLFNPPPELRGMILAAACMESGFNPNAKGDRKFSRSKKKPMAIGVLQQWPYYEKTYGTDRTNPKSAGTSWMVHIVKQIPKVKRQCKYKTDRKIWVAAWVTGIRYKKKGGRCNEHPKHYRLLKKWHRQIERDRKLEFECTEYGVCGC